MRLDRVFAALSGLLSAVSVVIAITSPSEAAKHVAVVVAIVFGVLCVAIIVWELARGVTRRVTPHQQATMISPQTVPLPKEIRHRVINSADFVPIILRRTFRHCEIVGSVHLPGAHVERSTWILGSFTTVNNLATDLPVDTCSFIDCKFFDCEFKGCTGLGTKAQIASLKAAFAIPDDDPQWS